MLSHTKYEEKAVSQEKDPFMMKLVRSYQNKVLMRICLPIFNANQMTSPDVDKSQHLFKIWMSCKNCPISHRSQCPVLLFRSPNYSSSKIRSRAPSPPHLVVIQRMHQSRPQISTTHMNSDVGDFISLIREMQER